LQFVTNEIVSNQQKALLSTHWRTLHILLAATQSRSARGNNIVSMGTHQSSVEAIVIAIVIATILATGQACNGNDSPATGSAIVVARALQATAVKRVQVNVQGSRLGIPIARELSQVGSQFSTVIGNIPPGNDYAFTASASDASTPPVTLLHGSITGQVITPNHTANVIINLNTATPSLPNVNSSPVVDTISTSSLVAARGEQIRLQTTAHDPDPGETAQLAFSWSATCGTLGGIHNSAGNDVTDSESAAVFTAPNRDANCSILLTVTDPKSASAAISLNIAVRTEAGQIGVATALNSAPIISGLSADPAELVPGQTTNLSVLASDPDGDALDYRWTSSCQGAFALASSSDTVFTLDPSSSVSACTFSVVVGDGFLPAGQSKNRVANHLTLAVGAPTLLGPPRFGVAYQSEDALDDDDVVSLAIAASDPAGGAIGFTWEASAGQAPSAADPASLGFGTGEFASAATWTAPAGASSGPLVTVTVTATGALSSLSSKYAFLLMPAKSACVVQNILCPAGQVCDPAAGRCVDVPGP
jgi:hypothetical protein